MDEKSYLSKQKEKILKRGSFDLKVSKKVIIKENLNLVHDEYADNFENAKLIEDREMVLELKISKKEVGFL